MEENLSFIENEPGMPASDEASQKIENAIENWKSMDEDRQCDSYKRMSYWKTVSSCSAL
jgi:nuclear transport factor 2 (NTF2) superfamily protein